MSGSEESLPIRVQNRRTKAAKTCDCRSNIAGAEIEQSVSASVAAGIHISDGGPSAWGVSAASDQSCRVTRRRAEKPASQPSTQQTHPAAAAAAVTVGNRADAAGDVSLLRMCAQVWNHSSVSVQPHLLISATPRSNSHGKK